MTRGVNSAFFDALQGDNLQITELIELDNSTQSWKWTVSNENIVSSLSTYSPFPGQSVSGVEESNDLGLSVTDFILSNSGGEFDELLDAYDLDMADLVIRRVFTNTPDLGSMEIFRGKLGDYSYTRREITGQARNLFNGINIKWPYYTYMDQCTWRFGSTGCAFDTTSITITGSLFPSTDKLNITTATSTFIGSSYANGYFDFGRVTFTSGQNSGEIRTIRTHTGDLFGLSHTTPFNVDSGDTFSIFPGCRKRLIDDCTSKYDNTSNFLGFPWIPRQEQGF